MADWYYKSKGEVIGPFSTAEFRRLARTGEITPATEIRQGETGKWALANQAQGLFQPNTRPDGPISPDPPVFRESRMERIFAEFFGLIFGIVLSFFALGFFVAAALSAADGGPLAGTSAAVIAGIMIGRVCKSVFSWTG